MPFNRERDGDRISLGMIAADAIRGAEEAFPNCTVTNTGSSEYVIRLNWGVPGKMPRYYKLKVSEIR